MCRYPKWYHYTRISESDIQIYMFRQVLIWCAICIFDVNDIRYIILLKHIRLYKKNSCCYFIHCAHTPLSLNLSSSFSVCSFTVTQIMWWTNRKLSWILTHWSSRNTLRKPNKCEICICLSFLYNFGNSFYFKSLTLWFLWGREFFAGGHFLWISLENWKILPNPKRNFLKFIQKTGTSRKYYNLPK